MFAPIFLCSHFKKFVFCLWPNPLPLFLQTQRSDKEPHTVPPWSQQPLSTLGEIDKSCSTSNSLIPCRTGSYGLCWGFVPWGYIWNFLYSSWGWTVFWCCSSGWPLSLQFRCWLKRTSFLLCTELFSSDLVHAAHCNLLGSDSSLISQIAVISISLKLPL